MQDGRNDMPILTPPNEPLISGFDVIDTKTGEYPDLWKIALKEDWANGLMYCDMEGFAIEEDGTLLLLDEWGLPGRWQNSGEVNVMDDRTLALLGDKAAQERITERGELLACPFCGGEVEEQDNWIFCTNCGVGYEEFYPEVSKELWNRRAPILTETQLALLKIAEKPRKFREGEK